MRNYICKLKKNALLMVMKSDPERYADIFIVWSELTI